MMNIKEKLKELNMFDVSLNLSDLQEEAYKEISQKTGFDILAFKEIVKLQRSLNDKIDPNWISNELDWQLAITLESAELLDSTDWKWWKKGKTDWKNIEIELIDLFHFLLAKLIETNTVDAIIPLFIANQNKTFDFDDEQKTQYIIEEGKELIKYNHLDNIILTFSSWLNCWLAVSDYETLFKVFKMKYVLNNFRQDHGYKEGTYIKDWDGVEDNVVAQDIIVNLDYDEKFEENLYNKLEEIYVLIQPKNKNNIQEFIENTRWKLFIEQSPEGMDTIITELLKDFSEYNA